MGGFRLLLLSISKRGQRSNIAAVATAFSAIKVFFSSSSTESWMGFGGGLLALLAATSTW